MSLAFYPFYAERFEAATTHLSMLEDGAFNRLLRLCWRSPGCKVPDDKGWIYRQMRAGNAAEKAAIDRVLAEFFKRGKGKIWNAKLLEIHAQVSAAHLNKSEAGKRGAAAKALKRNETEASTAKATLKQPEPEPKEEKREPNGSLSSGDDVAVAVAAYNDSAGEAGWPKVQVLSKPRRSALRQRLAECGGLDGWRAALARARASPHLCGQNDRGWTASFDFLTQASSFAKLMEGNYDPKPYRNTGRISESPKRVNPALDQIARLSGIGAAPGDGGIRVGSPGEEIGSLWVGTRPQ